MRLNTFALLLGFHFDSPEILKIRNAASRSENKHKAGGTDKYAQQ